MSSEEKGYSIIEGMIRQTLDIPIEKDKDMTFSIFPNPANEFINLKIDNNSIDDYNFSIHSLIGNQMDFQVPMTLFNLVEVCVLKSDSNVSKSFSFIVKFSIP